MYKTQSNQIKNMNKDTYNLLRRLCWHSARLYNYGLYTVRQNYFETKTYLPYVQNYHYCKTNENFKVLPAAVAQQTLKVVDRSFKSFFGLLNAKKHSKYQNRVSIPHYLPKDGYFQVMIPNNGFQIKGNEINIGISRFLKEDTGIKNIVLDFPTQINAKDVIEVRIIPQQKAHYFKMEVVYEVKEQELKLEHKNVLSIDIGLNNLATCFDTKNNRAFILDGRRLKSINYYWNKQNSKLQSIKDKQNIRNYTKQQFLLKRKRENRIKDIIRKSSKYISDYCIKNNIGNIIVGHNKGWKQDINLGRVNNQKFVQVPFGYMMSSLESKCEEFGMKYSEIQESHTSLCSALDNEEVKHHDVYMGKRIYRGLFRSREGKLVNADVNGAINIARKSKVTAMEVTSEQLKGIVAYPVRIRVF